LSIEKLYGQDCEYYKNLAEALTEAHAFSRELADARQGEYGARRPCGGATVAGAIYARRGHASR